MEASYQICSNCVMDNRNVSISFDSSGVCNYCRDVKPLLEKIKLSEHEVEKHLAKIAEKIRSAGEKNEYDCILGVSGGVDSSYAAYVAWKLGLRVLLVHVDNGWDSEQAVENIKRIMDTCDFELYTYVIDWEEFKDLQRAFFKASVIDIEMLSDHAITAVVYNLAKEFGIKYVISGSNIATESGMPKEWVWNKQDLINIKSIHKRFGELPMKTFPTLSTFKRTLRHLLHGFEFIRILNFVNYGRLKAKKVLMEELGWKDYGHKHYESLFTKFYQAYVLPEKFGVDKRKAHFSALIRNGEMTRDEALQELKKPPYSDSNELRKDKEYVLKKLSFSESEFDTIMKTPPKSHLEYPSEEHFYRYIKPIIKKFVRA